MGFESVPTPKKEEPFFESAERQGLFNERSGYENQCQAALNKENSIRKRYGNDPLDEAGNREIEEAQREQAMAQRMIDDVDRRLRNTK